jgi:hypothetical protein
MHLSARGLSATASVYRTLCAHKNDSIVVVLSTIVDPRRDFPQNLVDPANEGLHTLDMLCRTFGLVILVPRDRNLGGRTCGKELA